MKKLLLIAVCICFISHYADAQVTQINNNKSLSPILQLNPNLVIALSDLDETLWATDGTVAGTIQLSASITFVGGGAVVNGQFIFGGSTAATGGEIFITDGTPAGTKLVKDIYPGATGSDPDENMAVLNGFAYFTTATAQEGRELWRTSGTEASTTLVKDIIPGTAGSNDPDSYELTVMGNFLLLDVKTAANGNELWRSDGTGANTFMLKDIVAGPSSSDPRAFYFHNNVVLFTTTSADAAHAELWRTDGTANGTKMLMDNINAGLTGVDFYNTFFHVFDNRAYFLVDDDTHTGGIWSTDGIDGTTAHTSFLKELGTPAVFSSVLLLDAVNLAGKFIFPVSDFTDRFELWESDGKTAAGTKVFKSFPANADGNTPIIYLNIGYNLANQTISYPLYNGKFFFSASSTAGGNELWLSDGNPDPSHTYMVKDVNPGTENGLNENLGYIYTTAGLYFAVSDGTHGNELWKTDGTDAGTTLVKDIFPNAGDADPSPDFIVNHKILFTATDGDDPDNWDLYVVEGVFNALPVKLVSFTVTPQADDALLKWSTAQEINSRDFIVQSSEDAQHWEEIGTVKAAGNSGVKKDYSFIDAGVINSGKSVIFYRLVTTDVDGKSQFSEIISLKLKNREQWNVQLVTNPVRDEMKVRLTGLPGTAQLSVNDISGKTIFKMITEKQDGFITIPLNIQSGIYVLVAKIKNETRVIKFVKE